MSATRSCPRAAAAEIVVRAVAAAARAPASSPAAKARPAESRAAWGAEPRRPMLTNGSWSETTAAWALEMAPTVVSSSSARASVVARSPVAVS